MWRLGVGCSMQLRWVLASWWRCAWWVLHAPPLAPGRGPALHLLNRCEAACPYVAAHAGAGRLARPRSWMPW